MSGKIPWYLKDDATDPYARTRGYLSRALSQLTPEQRLDWNEIRAENENWDGEAHIEWAVFQQWRNEVIWGKKAYCIDCKVKYGEYTQRGFSYGVPGNAARFYHYHRKG